MSKKATTANGLLINSIRKVFASLFLDASRNQEQEKCRDFYGVGAMQPRLFELIIAVVARLSVYVFRTNSIAALITLFTQLNKCPFRIVY